MAPTVTITKQNRIGNKIQNTVNFAWDATYPAGGEAVTANQLGLGTIDSVVPVGTTSGFGFEYIASTGKIMAYYGDYNAGADGALIEVAVGDTAILTGVVTQLVVTGQ